MITFRDGYRNFCCCSCSNKFEETKNKLRNTISGYTPEKRKEIKNKKKKTCEEKYGGIGFASNALKEKYEKTMKEEYGAKHNFLVPEIIEKRNNTWIEKYSADNPMKNNEIANKVSKTQKNFTKEQKTKIIEKSKNTKKEKYGDENYTNRKQMENTCKEKYGFECPMKSEQCRKKLSNTLLKKKQKKYPFIIKYSENDKNTLVCKCVNDNCEKRKEKNIPNNIQNIPI